MMALLDQRRRSVNLYSTLQGTTRIFGLSLGSVFRGAASGGGPVTTNDVYAESINWTETYAYTDQQTIPGDTIAWAEAFVIRNVTAGGVGGVINHPSGPVVVASLLNH